MSEFKDRRDDATYREVLRDGMMYHGIAVCNLANDVNPEFVLPDRYEGLVSYARLNGVGLELQLEHGVQVPSVRERPPFIGVHLPTQNIEPYDRPSTISELATALDHAVAIRADYAVIHMQTQDYWQDMKNRATRIEYSKDVFRRMHRRARERGYTGNLLIENLEYPKYPATKAEIADAVSFLNTLKDENVGLAIDAGHLWRSGYLIGEKENGAVIASDADDWSFQRVSFEQYLEDVVAQHAGTIRLLHMTGCRGIHTHNEPDPYVTPVFTEPYMNVGRVYAILRSHLRTTGHPVYVVNEAIGFTYPQMAQASRTLVAYK